MCSTGLSVHQQASGSAVQRFHARTEAQAEAHYYQCIVHRQPLQIGGDIPPPEGFRDGEF